MATHADVVRVRLAAVHLHCEACGQCVTIRFSGAEDAFTREVLNPLRSWVWAHRAPKFVRGEVEVVR